MITESEEKDTNFFRLFHYSSLVIFIVFIALIVIINYYTSQEGSIGDSIYPNVYIDNHYVGEKSKSEIEKMYRPQDDQFKKAALTVMYKDEAIATMSAEKLNVHVNYKDVIDRAYLVGRTPHAPSRFYQKVATIFHLAKFNFQTDIVYDKGTLQEYTDMFEDHYNKPAKNALFNFEDGKVTKFREHEDGLKINSEDFIKEVDKRIPQLASTKNKQTITLTDTVVEPEIKLNEANNFGIEELIGEGTSDFTHSIPERIHNLTLASSKFNGVLIEKGKVISFNEIVGDISSNTGYKPAYVIQNGRTVLGDGGGVCQVSSTLFRVALNTGLPILERTSHAYRVSYYENDVKKPGLDATIFSPSVDLKIMNDTPAAILIQTEIDSENNILKFKFYGKKDGRTVELSPITVYDESPAPPPVYQDDPTLKKGIVKQVDFAAPGAKSKFTYKVHMGDKTTFDKTFYSVYRPWAAVFLVGQAD